MDFVSYFLVYFISCNSFPQELSISLANVRHFLMAAHDVTKLFVTFFFCTPNTYTVHKLHLDGYVQLKMAAKMDTKLVLRKFLFSLVI